MWGSHRVIYIFTDATGELSLYYDIKLKEPLETQTTGGAIFPTPLYLYQGDAMRDVLEKCDVIPLE